MRLEPPLASKDGGPIVLEVNFEQRNTVKPAFLRTAELNSQINITEFYPPGKHSGKKFRDVARMVYLRMLWYTGLIHIENFGERD